MRTLTSLLTLIAFVLSAYAADPAPAKPKPKPYPFQTCLVTDEKLGGMGKEYVFTYEGREIKFCCKGCMKDFKKDPAKYLKKLDAAEKADAPTGPAAKPSE
ncbi:MAG: hypothetical protein IT578_07750 [Verrucomicrobiae bacterium]|nr:hypothetical protein [Verrucomicrobiae bacterium]